MATKKLLSGHELMPRQMDDTVRLHPEGWVLPRIYAELYADKIYSFKFRPDDLLVMTNPKCGTTWMQEILWTMINNPNLNHPDAHIPIMDRSPEISADFMLHMKGIDFKSTKEWFKRLCPGRKEEDGVMLQICEMIPGRRIIKTHLGFSLLPPDLLDTAKVVYVARNPKDAFVSRYKMLQNMSEVARTLSFQESLDLFLKDDDMYTPFWLHVQQAWERRCHPNLHFVFYENLRTDTMAHLRRLNDFIGTNLTEKQLENVAQHTSFDTLKSRGEPMKDKVYSNFFRKGNTGDWKNHFSPEQSQAMDRWIKQHQADIGITFKYE